MKVGASQNSPCRAVYLVSRGHSRGAQTAAHVDAVSLHDVRQTHCVEHGHKIDELIHIFAKHHGNTMSVEESFDRGRQHRSTIDARPRGQSNGKPKLPTFDDKGRTRRLLRQATHARYSNGTPRRKTIDMATDESFAGRAQLHHEDGKSSLLRFSHYALMPNTFAQIPKLANIHGLSVVGLPAIAALRATSTFASLNRPGKISTVLRTPVSIKG